MMRRSCETLRRRRASRLVLGIALLLGSLAAPGPAGGAQPPGTVQRVGIIHHGGLYQVLIDGLRQGLRELGLEEGKHVVLDIRDTKGDLTAVGEAARDFERRKVDLLYTAATSVTTAARRATTQHPHRLLRRGRSGPDRAGAEPRAARGATDRRPWARRGVEPRNAWRSSKRSSRDSVEW